MYQNPKGLRDILPPETSLWQSVETTARQILHLYNFKEIRTPVMEFTEVFTRSIGEDTDIVEKEMYTFSDRAGRSLTLRPEGTASVVRAFVQHALFQKAGPHRFYYIGPMFRYERPQKGRYRQFHQIGAEVFGDPGPRIDAEVLDMLHLFFKRLGLQGL
ncbi:MAG: histidine--tRNA ligase, partial [Nitrospirae bacterium]